MQCFLKTVTYYDDKSRHSSYQLEIRNHEIHSNSLCVYAPIFFLLIDSIAFKASNTYMCGIVHFTHLHISKVIVDTLSKLLVGLGCIIDEVVDTLQYGANSSDNR